MPKPVITFVFKVLRNPFLPYVLYTCPNRDNVRVQSAMQSIASVHTLHMRSCSKCYAIHCFGTYLHMPKPVITFVFKVLRNPFLPYVLYTCPNRDNVRVQSAMQSIASVHTLHMRSCSKCYAIHCFGTYLHMPKPVITFVFKVLRNPFLPYVLYTCPNRDNVRVQSAMQSIASVHTLHMRSCSKCYAIHCFGT